MFNFFKSKRKIIEMLENANRKIFDECVYLRNKNHDLTQEIKRLSEELERTRNKCEKSETLLNQIIDSNTLLYTSKDTPKDILSKNKQMKKKRK